MWSQRAFWISIRLPTLLTKWAVDVNMTQPHEFRPHQNTAADVCSLSRSSTESGLSMLIWYPNLRYGKSDWICPCLVLKSIKSDESLIIPCLAWCSAEELFELDTVVGNISDWRWSVAQWCNICFMGWRSVFSAPPDKRVETMWFFFFENDSVQLGDWRSRTQSSKQKALYSATDTKEVCLSDSLLF